MHKSILAVVVFASVATFRRAGHGFTDKGTAFVANHFSEQQRAAIEAEPRLSVKEMPEDAIPDGVDRTPFDRAPTAQAAQETEPKKAAAQKTPAQKKAAEKQAQLDTAEKGAAENGAGE